MAKGRLAYITGISGTGVRQALRKYQSWCSRNGYAAPLVAGLEDDYLVPLARPYARQLHKIPDQDVDIIELLTLPKPLLDKLWGEAFDQAISQIAEARGRGEDTILTFHSVWYHLSNREYLSCVDLGRLARDESRVDVVITLVDDIYDVKSRLGRPRGLFSVPAVNQSDYLDAIIKLLRVLEWRNFETVLSSKIAEICGAHHYLLGTKHPLVTFHDLVTRAEKGIVYLAHPISQVRRLMRKGGEDADRAEAMIQRVGQLAVALRDNFVVLEPTAIDELRFDNEAVIDGDRIVVPKLSWRWPLASVESEDLLWSQVSGTSEPFGHSWEVKAGAIEGKSHSEWNAQERSELKEAAPLLLTLQENVQMQIKSRDFALVSQADGIVVYRPMFEGHESSGVRLEIDYHDELSKVGLDRALTVVLHPDEDEFALRRELLRDYLRGWCSSGELEGDVADLERLISEITIEDVRLLVESDTDGGAGRSLEELVTKYTLKFVSGQPSGAMGSDQIALARGKERERGEAVRSLRSYLAGLQSPKIQVIKEPLSVADFAHRVEALLNE